MKLVVLHRCLAFNKKDEAKGNELCVPGRQTTVHASAFIIAGKKATEASRSLLSEHTFSLWDFSFYVHRHKLSLKAFSPSQQLAIKQRSQCISPFSDHSSRGCYAWFTEILQGHSWKEIPCLLYIEINAYIDFCAILTARKSMQYIPKEEWPE